MIGIGTTESSTSAAGLSQRGVVLFRSRRVEKGPTGYFETEKQRGHLLFCVPRRALFGLLELASSIVAKPNVAG